MGLQFPLRTRISTEEKNTGYVRRARHDLLRFVVFFLDGGEENKWRGAKLEWPGPARLRLARLGSASQSRRLV